MRRRLSELLCVVCMFCMVACSDDKDKNIPSYITDLVVLTIDADGRWLSVTLDDGTSYDIRSQQLTSEKKDTLLRCMATYALEKGKMEVYGMKAVFCVSPALVDSFSVVKDGETYYGHEYLPRDPMKVVSMWKSGGYINLHLGLMTTGEGTHKYAFCEDSVGHYSLLHLRPDGDAESYMENVYMSMPVPDSVDNLTFSVYTYQGIHTRIF